MKLLITDVSEHNGLGLVGFVCEVLQDDRNRTLDLYITKSKCLQCSASDLNSAQYGVPQKTAANVYRLDIFYS